MARADLLRAAVWGLSEETRGAGRGLSDRSVDVLEALVTSPLQQAEKLLGVLQTGDDESELAEVLREPDEFRGLTVDLARNFLLLAPATYRPGQYEVLKYSHSRPLPWRQSASNLAARFGLTDFTTEFRRLPLGLSGSYHFQVEAPDEVVLSRARLTGSYLNPEGDVRSDESLDNVNVALDEDGDSPVVNLHGRRPSRRVLDAAADFKPRRGWLRRGHEERPPDLPGDPLEATIAVRSTGSQRSDSGFASLRFRPRLSGTFIGAAVTSGLATLLLLLARPRLAEMNGEAGSALLLALPILATGYLGRPGEHAFAARLLGGVRAIAVLVGLCSLVVAGILAGGFIEDPLLGPPHVPDGVQLIADLATCVAVGATLVLWLGFVRTWLSPKSPRSSARSARDRTGGRRLVGPLR